MPSPWPVLGCAASAVLFLTFVVLVIRRSTPTRRAVFLRYTSATRWYERVVFALGLGVDVAAGMYMNQANGLTFSGGLVVLVYFLAPMVPAAARIMIYRLTVRPPRGSHRVRARRRSV